MDERIQQIYEEELEKDITNKLENKGYNVINCDVKANILNDKENSQISKIKLRVEKNQEFQNNIQENDIENKIVTEVQKIKKIDTSIKSQENSNNQKEDVKMTKEDVQNIKKFLIEEYEVNESCLEIK